MLRWWMGCYHRNGSVMTLKTLDHMADIYTHTHKNSHVHFLPWQRCSRAEELSFTLQYSLLFLFFIFLFSPYSVCSLVKYIYIYIYSKSRFRSDTAHICGWHQAVCQAWVCHELTDRPGSTVKISGCRPDWKSMAELLQNRGKVIQIEGMELPKGRIADMQDSYKYLDIPQANVNNKKRCMPLILRHENSSKCTQVITYQHPEKQKERG